MFGRTFSQKFNLSNVIYNNQISYNPDNKINSWFQNFEIKINNLIILCLDWNSRFKNPIYDGALVFIFFNFLIS
jgi:hypothetical protein